jgi:hypothetical protein
MKRALKGLVLASLISTVAGACSDSAQSYPPTGGGGSSFSCSAYTSCGTCTPVDGCGWCYDSDGTGVCASDPDQCPTPAFSWTWDSDGCRVAADASVVPVSSPAIDAAATIDAGAPTDASIDAPAPPLFVPFSQ